MQFGQTSWLQKVIIVPRRVRRPMKMRLLAKCRRISSKSLLWAAGWIFACASLYVFHAKVERLESRLLLKSSATNRNRQAATLLMNELLNNTGNRSIDVSSRVDLNGVDEREVGKELGRLLLQKVNISVGNILAKMNYSLITDNNGNKNLLRAHVQKAIELKSVKEENSARKNDTPVCRIHEMDPFDKSILPLIKKPEPLVCEGTMTTYIRNKQLVLKKPAANEIRKKVCYVSSVERKTDFVSFVSFPTKVKITENQTKLPGGDILLQSNLTSDFTIVACLDEKSEFSEKTFDEAFSDSETFHTFYQRNLQLFDRHARIISKPEVLERLRDFKPPKDGLGLNVLLLAIESTSRMNSLRYLPMTREVLKQLGGVELEGYNILADATLGSMIPLLTGHRETELPDVGKINANASFVNSYPMIWKDFAKHGFATSFVEDCQRLTTFNWRFKGFDEQPTDHYMQAFWSVVGTKGHCLGPTPVHNVLFDYMQDFLTKYKDKPHFGLFFLATYTHEDFNPLGLVDASLSSYLTNITKLGLLDNTLFLLFGDHGSRYSSIRKTMQGKLEERLPLMYVTLPRWFSERHPDLARNLARNRKRLVTPFDVHETLRDVLHHEPTSERGNRRGLSLFGEIPWERTCDDAQIPPHFCACLTWEPAKLDPKMANKIGEAFVRELNSRTERVRDWCVKLTLGAVLHVKHLLPNQQVLRFQETGAKQQIAKFGQKADVDPSDLPAIYQVTMETLPGNGLYEGTLESLPGSTDKKPSYQSTGDISRINKYGHTADCILDLWPTAQAYCYCKDNLLRN